MSSTRRPTNSIDRYGLPRLNQLPIQYASDDELNHANRMMHEEILANAKNNHAAIHSSMSDVSKGAEVGNDLTGQQIIKTNLKINQQAHAENYNDDILGPPKNNNNDNDIIPITPPQIKTLTGVVSGEKNVAINTSPTSLKTPNYQTVGTYLNFFQVEGKVENENTQEPKKTPPPLPARSYKRSHSSSTTG